MAVLMRAAALAAVALAGCYAPELRDCTVTCASAVDCAGDQICGDGYCVSPEVGACTGQPAVDGATVEPPDAPPPDTGPPHTTLRIEYSGKGQVNVTGVGTCADPPCEYSVPVGMALALEAIPGSGFEFERWEAGPCALQDATCNATASPPMTRIKARFKND